MSPGWVESEKLKLTPNLPRGPPRYKSINAGNAGVR